MRNLRPIAGSLAAHAAVIGVLVWFAGESTTEKSPSQPSTIELVDLVEPALIVANAGGGGTPARTETPEPAPEPKPSPIVRPAIPRTVQASLGGLTIESHGTGNGVGGGHGNGVGDGIGDGTGPGRGALGLGDVPDVPAIPPPPPPPPDIKVSKARPARLIYPAREREAPDGELFVARIVVDHDGYVVGARLVRGRGGPRDTEAADLIWRFRYDPALDDDGHPIRSTFDQRFLVN